MYKHVFTQRRFPMDNLAEWNGGQPLGLRTVHAYVLVFDMANLSTFQVCIFKFYFFLMYDNIESIKYNLHI